jgi:hypothetical protein
MTRSKTAVSVRLCGRRLGMLGVRTVEGCGRVALGLICRQAGAGELLRLQVRFRARDGGLGGIIIRRRGGGRTGCAGCSDRLPGVAHFLHGRTRATDEAGHTHKYSK